MRTDLGSPWIFLLTLEIKFYIFRFYNLYSFICIQLIRTDTWDFVRLSCSLAHNLPWVLDDCCTLAGWMLCPLDSRWWKGPLSPLSEASCSWASPCGCLQVQGRLQDLQDLSLLNLGFLVTPVINIWFSPLVWFDIISVRVN